jgi:WD40 repeat protein
VPVLALQYLLVPIQGGCKNAYLIVSGATDGSIAVWDITNLIITFTKHMLSGVASLAFSAGTQLRPRTGRGSQGGRRFRSAKQRQAGLPRDKKKIEKSANAVESLVDEFSSKADVNVKESLDITEVAEANFEADIGSSARVNDVSEETGSLPQKSSVLHPLCTFTEAHQSGVNCLSAAKVAGDKDSEVVVVSGGDDQRIHVLRFAIHPCEGEDHHRCASASEPSGSDVDVVAAPSTKDSQGLFCCCTKTCQTNLLLIHRMFYDF